MLVQFVAIGTLSTLATSERPIADASAQFLGTKATAFVSLGALVSIGGTLNAIALVSPRLLFAMAADGHLPRFIGAVHPRFRTPYVAIVLSSIVMFALTLSGSFVALASISVVVRLLTYAATCAALLRLRCPSGTRAVCMLGCRVRRATQTLRTPPRNYFCVAKQRTCLGSRDRDTQPRRPRLVLAYIR